MTVYIETDCVFEHHGQTFESGGACYNGEHAIAYMSADMSSVTTWRGEYLGKARVTSSWCMPHSWVSSRQYQVTATIDGVTYTGRTMGGSMIWRGRRKHSNSRNERSERS